MSEIAGGTGKQEGVIYAGGTWNFAKNGYVRMDEQYAVDVFNTFYVDGKYPIAIDDKTSLTLGAQYYPQSSVGAAQIGSFSTYGVGLQADLARGPLAVQLYYTQTGKGFDTQAPFGNHAAISLLQVGLQHSWREGLGDRRQRQLLQSRCARPDRVRDLRARSPPDRLPDRQPLPNRNETDVRVDYAIGKGTILEGLVATFRYAWLHQDGSPQTRTQLRAILNYAVRF